MKIIYEHDDYAIAIKDQYNYTVFRPSSGREGTLPGGAPHISYTNVKYFSQLAGAVRYLSKIAADDHTETLETWLHEYAKVNEHVIKQLEDKELI